MLEGSQSNSEHSAQGFSRPPQKLIANGKGSDIVSAHGQMTQAPYRDIHGTCYSDRCEFGHALLTIIRDIFRPWGALLNDLFELVQGYFFAQFYCQRLTMRTHRPNADTKAINGHVIVIVVAQKLVALGPRFPFFARHPIAQI